MNTEHRIVEWNFWLQWVLANIVGFGLGGVRAISVAGALFGVSFGVAGGFTQGLALHRHVARSALWMLATASGWTISWALAASVSSFGPLVSGIAFGAGFGAITGAEMVSMLSQPVSEAT